MRPQTFDETWERYLDAWADQTISAELKRKKLQLQFNVAFREIDGWDRAREDRKTDFVERKEYQKAVALALSEHLPKDGGITDLLSGDATVLLPLLVDHPEQRVTLVDCHRPPLPELDQSIKELRLEKRVERLSSDALTPEINSFLRKKRFITLLGTGLVLPPLLRIPREKAEEAKDPRFLRTLHIFQDSKYPPIPNLTTLLQRWDLKRGALIHVYDSPFYIHDGPQVSGQIQIHLEDSVKAASGWELKHYEYGVGGKALFHAVLERKN